MILHIAKMEEWGYVIEMVDCKSVYMDQHRQEN
jgi:hypothetical protein